MGQRRPSYHYPQRAGEEEADAYTAGEDRADQQGLFRASIHSAGSVKNLRIAESSAPPDTRQKAVKRATAADVDGE